jgi:hypothetical protein
VTRFSRAPYLLLVGNGVSAGFDGALATSAITERVNGRLDAAELEVVNRLGPLLAVESASPGSTALTFEALAGPADRMATALIALQGLLASAGGNDLFDALDSASLALRRFYFRLVGIVLDEIDRLCVAAQPVAEERRASWSRLNEFVEALLGVPGVDNSRRIFTLSYDSLLDSAILEVENRLYDGFPGLVLSPRLEPRPGWPELYHLHGSVAWVTDPEERVFKRQLEYLRATGLLDEWVSGQPSSELPTVVLGDLKTPTTGRYPFALFYDELRRGLESAQCVVAAGIGFGDRPINSLLAEYLGRDRSRHLLVWKRSSTPVDEFVSLLRAFPAGRSVEASQITVQQVTLPDPDAVASL